MSDSKETQTATATPEQLMQMLDCELAANRSHRKGTNRNRAAILVVGVLLIVIGGAAALLVLDQMVADLRQNGQFPPPASQSAQTNF